MTTDVIPFYEALIKSLFIKCYLGFIKLEMNFKRSVAAALQCCSEPCSGRQNGPPSFTFFCIQDPWWHDLEASLIMKGTLSPPLQTGQCLRVALVNRMWQKWRCASAKPKSFFWNPGRVPSRDWGHSDHPNLSRCSMRESSQDQKCPVVGSPNWWPAEPRGKWWLFKPLSLGRFVKANWFISFLCVLIASWIFMESFTTSYRQYSLMCGLPN